MTISTTENSQLVAGTGAIFAFDFDFVGDSSSVISVTYLDADGNQTVLSPSQYTLTLNPPGTNQLWGIGGVLTYPLVGSAIAAGTYLLIERILPFTQETSVRNQGNYYPTVTERALDTLEMQIQQVNAAVQRSIQIPAVDVGINTILPSAVQRANQFLKFDANGNVIVSEGTGTIVDTTPADPGFAPFVIPPLVAPDVIFSNGVPSGGLTGYTLPAGEAILDSAVVTIPQVSLTVGANLVTDYYLNPNGSSSPWTITTESIDTYTLATRYPNLIHVWNIESNATDITAINMTARTKPVPPQTTDAARVVDQIAGLYVIRGDHTNWSSGGTATVGEIILNTTTAPGNLYLVFTAGTLGTSAPSSTGTDTFLNGTALLGYYGQLNYCNNFRYSVGGGIFVYFANIAAGFFSDLQGTSGTYIGPTYVKPFFINTFYNLIVPRVNSGTYSFGQKIAAGGYYWISTTITAGAVAGSSPFSGTYAPGTLVTDGAVVWKCIQQAYGSPTLAWYWFDTDRTMTVLNLTNAGDSNPTTFFRALWQYIQATNDWVWLNGNSPIPSGSGTYYTYAECLGQIFDYNISTLYNSWTPTFQQNIIPTTGQSFTIQYLEDNAESYSGFVAALNIFFILLDNTRANIANTNANLCSNKIFTLWNSTYGVFPWYLTDDFSWVNNPANQWYPYYQAQLFPELEGVPITDQQKQAARAYIMTNWTNWPQDPGLSVGFPAIAFGYVAAKYWQDNDKARSIINIVEDQFLQDGLFVNKGRELLVSDFSYYLQTKKILIPNNRITRVKGDQLSVVDAKDNMNILNGIRSGNDTYPFIITYLDETVIINNVSGTPVFAALYIQNPSDGKKIKIIDGSGDASIYPITVTPYSGNINGEANFVLNSNYGQAEFTYNFDDGQWLAIASATSYLTADSTQKSGTITAAGTVGARTINKPCGSVNFAAGAVTLVVTNSLVTANSLVNAYPLSTDGSFTNCYAVPIDGSFTIIGNASADAETRVGFEVTNAI